MGYNSKSSPPDHQYIKVGRANTVNYRDTSNFDGVTFSGTGTEIAITFDINTKCPVDALQFVFVSPVDLGGAAGNTETSPWTEGVLARQIFAIPSNGLVQTSDSVSQNVFGNSPAPPLEQWNYKHNHPIYASGGFNYPYDGSSESDSKYTFQYANNALDNLLAQDDAGNNLITNTSPPRLIVNRFGAHWHYRIVKREAGNKFWYRVVVWSDNPRYNIPSTFGQDLPLLTLVFPGTPGAGGSAARIMAGNPVGDANNFGRISNINDAAGNAAASEMNVVGANNLYVDDDFTQMAAGHGGLGVMGKPRDVSNASWTYALTVNGVDVGTGPAYDSANLTRWGLTSNSAVGAHDVFDIEAVALHIVGAAVTTETANARTDDDYGVAGNGYGTITAITQANPGVVTTSAAHGLVDGDVVTFAGVVGMTQLNGNKYIVDVTAATTFNLTAFPSKANVNTGGYGAWSAGGSHHVCSSLWNSGAVPDGGLPSGIVKNNRYQNGLSVIDLITQRNYLINDAQSGAGIVGIVPPPGDIHLADGNSYGAPNAATTSTFAEGFIPSSFEYCDMYKAVWRWDASAGHVTNMASDNSSTYLNMGHRGRFIWADNCSPSYVPLTSNQAEQNERLYPNTINFANNQTTDKIEWSNKGMGEEGFYRDSFKFLDSNAGAHLITLSKGTGADTGYQGFGGDEQVPTHTSTLLNYSPTEGSEFYTDAGRRNIGTGTVTKPQVEFGGAIALTVTGGSEINNSAAHNVLFEAYSNNYTSGSPAAKRMLFGIQVGLKHNSARVVPKVYVTQIVVDIDAGAVSTGSVGSKIYTNTVISNDLPTTFSEAYPVSAAIVAVWNNAGLFLRINGNLVAVSSQNLFDEASIQASGEFLNVPADGEYPMQDISVAAHNATANYTWMGNVGGTGTGDTLLGGCYGLWNNLKQNTAENWVLSKGTGTITAVAKSTGGGQPTTFTDAGHGLVTGNIVKLTLAGGGGNEWTNGVSAQGTNPNGFVGPVIRIDDNTFTVAFDSSHADYVNGEFTSGSWSGASNHWRDWQSTDNSGGAEVVHLDTEDSVSLDYIITPAKTNARRGEFSIGEVMILCGTSANDVIADSSGWDATAATTSDMLNAGRNVARLEGYLKHKWSGFRAGDDSTTHFVDLNMPRNGMASHPYVAYNMDIGQGCGCGENWEGHTWVIEVTGGDGTWDGTAYNCQVSEGPYNLRRKINIDPATGSAFIYGSVSTSSWHLLAKTNPGGTQWASVRAAADNTAVCYSLQSDGPMVNQNVYINDNSNVHKLYRNSNGSSDPLANGFYVACGPMPNSTGVTPKGRYFYVDSDGTMESYQAGSRWYFENVPDAGATVKLYSTDGTTKTYRWSDDADGASGTVVSGTGNSAIIRVQRGNDQGGNATAKRNFRRDAFRTAVQHTDGHNGKITLTQEFGGRSTVVQTLAGSAGNTVIELTGNHGFGSDAPADNEKFVAGADYNGIQWYDDLTSAGTFSGVHCGQQIMIVSPSPVPSTGLISGVSSITAVSGPIVTTTTNHGLKTGQFVQFLGTVTANGGAHNTANNGFRVSLVDANGTNLGANQFALQNARLPIAFTNGSSWAVAVAGGTVVAPAVYEPDSMSEWSPDAWPTAGTNTWNLNLGYDVPITLTGSARLNGGATLGLKALDSTGASLARGWYFIPDQTTVNLVGSTPNCALGNEALANQKLGQQLEISAGGIHSVGPNGNVRVTNLGDNSTSDVARTYCNQTFKLRAKTGSVSADGYVSGLTPWSDDNPTAADTINQFGFCGGVEFEAIANSVGNDFVFYYLKEGNQTEKVIADVTKGGVTTSFEVTGHGFAVKDQVRFSNLTGAGWTSFNDQIFTVTAVTDANNFTVTFNSNSYTDGDYSGTPGRVVGTYSVLPTGHYHLCEAEHAVPASNGARHLLNLSAAGVWDGNIYACTDTATAINVHTAAQNSWYDEDLWTWNKLTSSVAHSTGTSACLSVEATSQNLYIHGSLTDGTLKVYSDFANNVLAPAGWYWNCTATGPIPSGGDGPYREPFECVGEPFVWFSSTAPGSIKQVNSTKNILGDPSKWGIEDLTTTSCDLEDYDNGKYNGGPRYNLVGYTSAGTDAGGQLEYPAQQVTFIGAVSGQLTAASPTVINTTAAHNLISGDFVAFSGFAGGTWTTLNGGTFAVTVIDADSFSVAVDSSGFGTHTSGTGAAYFPKYEPALEFSGVNDGAGGGGDRFGLARYSGARTRHYFSSIKQNGIPAIVATKSGATDITVAMWVKLKNSLSNNSGTIFDFRDINKPDASVVDANSVLSRMTLEYSDLNTSTPDLILTTSKWAGGVSTDYTKTTTTTLNRLTLATNTSTLAILDKWCLIIIKAGSSGHSITINGQDGVSDLNVRDSNPSQFCTATNGITNFSPYIGCNFLGEDRAEMSLGDIIVYDNELDEVNTDELEGYLLHKWGAKFMPASHTYYTTGPDCIDDEECGAKICESSVHVKTATVASTNSTLTIPIEYRSSENVYGYQFKIMGLTGLGSGITKGAYADGVAKGNWRFDFSDPLGQGFENYAVVDEVGDVIVIGYFYDNGKGNLIEKYAPSDGTFQALVEVTITNVGNISGTIPASSSIVLQATPNNVDDNRRHSHPILSTYPSDEAALQKTPSSHWTGESSEDATSVSVADARVLVSSCVRSMTDHSYEGNPSGVSAPAYEYYERMDALRKGYHDVNDIVTLLLHIKYNGTASATSTPLSGSATPKTYTNREKILALPVCTEQLTKTECNPCPCVIPTPDECLSEIWISDHEPVGSQKDKTGSSSPKTHSASAQMPSIAYYGNYAVLTIMYRSSCCIDGYWIKFGNLKSFSSNPYSGVGGVLGFLPPTTTNPNLGGETGVRSWWESNGMDPDGDPLLPFYTLAGAAGHTGMTDILSQTGVAFPVAWGFAFGNMLKTVSPGQGKIASHLNAQAVWLPDRLGAWCIPATEDKKGRVLTRIVVNMDSFDGIPTIDSFRLVTNDERKAPNSYANYTWTGDTSVDADSTVGFDDLFLSMFYTWAGLDPVEAAPVGTAFNNDVDRFDAESDNKVLDVVDVLTVANHITMHGNDAQSSNSSLIVPQDCCPCEKPGNFTLTPTVYPCFCWEEGYDVDKKGTIKLEWTASSGAKGYKVLRKGWKKTSNANQLMVLDGAKARLKSSHTSLSDSNKEWEVVHIAQPGDTVWYDRNPAKPRRCCPDDVMPSTEYVVIAFNECGEVVQKTRVSPKCCNRAPKANPLVLESNINQPVHFVTPVHDPDAPMPFGGALAAATGSILIATAGIPLDGETVSIRDSRGTRKVFKFNTGNTTVDGSLHSDGTSINVGTSGISAGGGSGALIAARLASAINAASSFYVTAEPPAPGVNVVNLTQDDESSCGNTRIIIGQTSGTIIRFDFSGGNKACDPATEDCDKLTINIKAVSVSGGYFVGGGFPVVNDGHFTYVPPPNYTGTVVITYGVVDSHGCRDKSTVTIRIKPPKLKIKCWTAPCNSREHGVVTVQWNRLKARVLNYEIYRKLAGAGDADYVKVGDLSGNVGMGSPIISWKDKPPRPDECCTGSDEDLSYTYRIAVYGLAAPVSWDMSNGEIGLSASAFYTSYQKPMAVSWECTVIIPCCPLPKNPIPVIDWSDCDGTQASVKIYGRGGFAGENGTTIVLLNADGTPGAQTFTTNASQNETQSTVTTIGTQGVDTAGKAAKSLWTALNASITANNLEMSLVGSAADALNNEYVVVRQNTVGSTGNTTITPHANLHILNSPVKFQGGYDAGDHVKVLMRWRPSLAVVGTVSTVIAGASTSMRIFNHGLKVGDSLIFSGFTGTWGTQLNGPQEFLVTSVPNPHTVVVSYGDGGAIDSGAFGSYTTNQAKAWSYSPIERYWVWRKRGSSTSLFKRLKEVRAEKETNIYWNGAEYYYEDSLAPCDECDGRYSVNYAVTASSKRGNSGNPNDATWYTWGSTSKTIASVAVSPTATAFNVSAGHGYSTGDFVTFTGITGTNWVNLNNQRFIITVASSTQFTIAFDSSTYTSGHYGANSGKANKYFQGDPCSPGGTTVTAGIECCPPTPCVAPINKTACIGDVVAGTIEVGCIARNSPAVAYAFADSGNGHYNGISSKISLNTGTGAYTIGTSSIAEGTYTWTISVTACGQTGTATFTLVLEDCGCPCPDDEKDYTICDFNYIQSDFTKSVAAAQIPFSLGRKGGQTLRRGDSVYVATQSVDGKSED